MAGPAFEELGQGFADHAAARGGRGDSKEDGRQAGGRLLVLPAAKFVVAVGIVVMVFAVITATAHPGHSLAALRAAWWIPSWWPSSRPVNWLLFVAGGMAAGGLLPTAAGVPYLGRR